MASRDETAIEGQQDMLREDGNQITSVPSRLSKIGTKGRFSLMEMPVELRLKIYNELLISPETINIPPSTDNPTPSTYPSTAILQTSKTINSEGIPILYSTNTFTITLPLERRSSTSETPNFRLSHFRWTTLSLMSSISFQSSNEISIPKISISHSPRPSFTCSGKDIIARFSTRDFRYSPAGPDEYMALSISNWVSTKVMRAELSAFQVELDVMMRGSGEFGFVNGGGDGDGDDAEGDDQDEENGAGTV